MQTIVDLMDWIQDILDKTRKLDFMAPLLIRLYLAPVLIVAGLHKFKHFDDVASWFAYLGFPFSELMTFLAASTELIGGLALLAGFATRWFSIPLMITMLVAAFAVHWKDGWFAIAPSNGESSPAYVLNMIGFPGAQESLENSDSVAIRLNKAKSILKEHGNYQWLSEKGSFVILNNGIEFAATYFIMLLTLFFIGAGRFVSVDHYIKQHWKRLRQKYQ